MNHQKGFSKLFFYPYYFLRRCAYALILYNLFDYPATQVLFNTILSLISLIYLCKSKPFHSKRDNMIHIVHEVCIGLSFIFSGLFILPLSPTISIIIEIITFIIASFVVTFGYGYSIVTSIIEIRKKCKKKNVACNATRKHQR